MQPIRNDILTVAPPRFITVTITEEDRQKADHFCGGRNCILATALIRMGYRNVVEDVDNARINGYFGTRYDHAEWGPEESCRVLGATQRPFYHPEVVGKTIVLTRRDA